MKTISEQTLQKTLEKITVNKHAFITDDFIIQDFDFSDLERYELTSCLKSKALNPDDYNFTGNQEEFQHWATDHLTFDELYEVPMMNSVYYYPSFITFSEEDRSKTASSTTLFFDTKQEQWAIGMTGGGMDLSPHLLDTFIELEKGIPWNIAKYVSLGYSAYISSEKHRLNCQLLAKAFYNLSNQMTGYSQRLLKLGL